MKSGVEILTWTVKYHNFNNDQIKDYNALASFTDDIKKAKKKYSCKEDFANWLMHEMMYYYWSKCEWELIIRKIDGRIYLYPWVGSRCPESVAIDVTDDDTFDWVGFADFYIEIQDFIENKEAKIDVYDQILYRWDEFVDYCWNTRLKYERVKK